MCAAASRAETLVLDLNNQQKTGSYRNICILLLLWFKMVIVPITKFSGREGFRDEFSLLLEQMIFFFKVSE